MTRDRAISDRTEQDGAAAGLRPALDDLARASDRLAERSRALEVVVIGWDMGRDPIRPRQTEDAR